MAQLTPHRLAAALEAAGAPEEMIDRAAAGYYDELQSWLATPIAKLALDLTAAGLHDLARAAALGAFDATPAEVAQWLAAAPGPAWDWDSDLANLMEDR